MPSIASVHTNAALSTFASGYKPGRPMADELVPIVSVTKRSDDIHQKTRKDTATPLDDEIGPNGTVSESDYDVTSTSYKVRDYGLKAMVSNEIIADADEPLKPLEDAVQTMMYRLWLRHEIRVAAVVDASGSYLAANVAAATAVWSNQSTSTPIKDIQTAIASIAPGAEQETELVMGLTLELWQALARHAELLGLRAGGGNEKGILKTEEVAAALGLDRIVVTDMQKNTANRALTAVYARVWSSTVARIVRRPKGEPRGKDASMFAGTFRTKRVGPEGWTVTQWDDPAIGPTGGIWVKAATSEHCAKVLQNDMAALITGCA